MACRCMVSAASTQSDPAAICLGLSLDRCKTQLLGRNQPQSMLRKSALMPSFDNLSLEESTCSKCVQCETIGTAHSSCFENLDRYALVANMQLLLYAASAVVKDLYTASTGDRQQDAWHKYWQI